MNWPALRSGQVCETDLNARLAERDSERGATAPETADREVARFMLLFVGYLFAGMGVVSLLASCWGGK